MLWFTQLRHTTPTTTPTGLNLNHLNRQRSLAMSDLTSSRATRKKNASRKQRHCPTPPLLAPRNSSAVISSEPSATARFTFPRLPADSQLCFELKRAHTNTRPSAISVAICLLISPGQADTVQQTDKQHKRSGAFQFKTPRLAKEHY